MNCKSCNNEIGTCYNCTTCAAWLALQTAAENAFMLAKKLARVINRHVRFLVTVIDAATKHQHQQFTVRGDASPENGPRISCNFPSQWREHNEEEISRFNQISFD